MSRSVVGCVLAGILAVIGAPSTSSQSCGAIQLPPGAFETTLPWSGGTEWVLIQPPTTVVPEPGLVIMFHGLNHDHCWENPVNPDLKAFRDDMFTEGAGRGSTRWTTSRSPHWPPIRDSR